MKKTLILFFLALLAAPLWGQRTYGEMSTDELRQRANNGDANAQGALGFRYYTGDRIPQDYKQAVHWWTKAANQGDTNAQFFLGACYYGGYGVAQDYKQAVYWFTKAANQGVANAQYYLGFCYYEGYGVAQDYKQAVYWYTKAANQGHATAQYYLGFFYHYGFGVAKDCRQALNWVKKAKAQENKLNDFLRMSLGDLLALAEECAETQAPSATPQSTSTTSSTGTTSSSTPKPKQVSAAELYSRGEAYFNGDGVEHSPEKAVELWTQSAEKGYTTAQLMLAECYKDGIGAKKDLRKAFEWYSKAASGGNANAQGEVALAYFHGNGVQADLSKAEMWAKKAWAQRSKMHDVLRGDVERLIKTDLPARKKQQSASRQQSSSTNKNQTGGNTQAKPRAISDDPSTAADQYELATRYHHGTAGKRKDTKKAIHWYARAANQGSPEAMLELGRIYYYGSSVDKDPDEALYWLQKIEFRQQSLQATKPALVKEALELLGRIKQGK